MGHIKIFGKTKIEGKIGFYQPPLYDSTASAYIAAVEAADGQALEASIRTAYNNFIVGCKADGIWTAIKASCILAGARTLNGALVPLVGTAPTNFNFVTADYNRKTGLVGNGSTKYLNSNRNNNADPQNNQHLSVRVASPQSSGLAGLYIGAGPISPTAGDNFSNFGRSGANPANIFLRSRNFAAQAVASGNATGFMGMSRSNSANYGSRISGVSTTLTQSSDTPSSGNIQLFKFSGPNYSDARLSFYSIGESLDLAKLDTRVSALMTAINEAI
jgi:hypothetical protein